MAKRETQEIISQKIDLENELEQLRVQMEENEPILEEKDQLDHQLKHT